MRLRATANVYLGLGAVKRRSRPRGIFPSVEGLSSEFFSDRSQFWQDYPQRSAPNSKDKTSYFRRLYEESGKEAREENS
jgi:hypothetical protein